jgi:hypothetical protein
MVYRSYVLVEILNRGKERKGKMNERIKEGK